MDKTRVPMTTQSIPLYRICGGIANLARMSENAELLGDYSKIKVSKYGVIFKTKNNKTAISIPDPSGVLGSECRLQQVFAFAMCKIKDELMVDGKVSGDVVVFHLNELVEYGIYSNYRAAKKGIGDIANFLGGVRINTKDADFIETILTEPEFRDVTFSLFTHFGLTERGKVKIGINKLVNWSDLTKQFIVNSMAMFRLSNLSFKLVMAILERIRIEKYDGPFDMSFRYVMSRLNLPSKTKNVERDIKKPIKEAIEEVNAYSNEFGFKIVPNYDSKMKLSKIINTGRLTVVLTDSRKDIERVKNLESMTKK